MSGSIVIASLGDGLPRGIQSILLLYDTGLRLRPENASGGTNPPGRKTRKSLKWSTGLPRSIDSDPADMFTAACAVARRVTFDIALAFLVADVPTSSFLPYSPGSR